MGVEQQVRIVGIGGESSDVVVRQRVQVERLDEGPLVVETCSASALRGNPRLKVVRQAMNDAIVILEVGSPISA